jgi:hypothetical protein
MMTLVSRNRRIAAASLIIAAFCGSCSMRQRIPEHAPGTFADWFVNPTQQTLRLMAGLHLSSSQWDTVIARARAGNAGPAGEAAVVLNDSAGAGHTLGYATPASFRTDAVYPLIIYLHGGIGGAKPDKGARAWDMLGALRDTLPLFLASPTATREAPWWAPQGIGRILQSLRYMTLHFPIDRDRIFLAGVSDGAVGCYAAANSLCKPFAGFIAISGFGGMLQQYKIPICPGNLMQRPMYTIYAGNDRIYPASLQHQFLDWLDSNGVSVQRSFYPDENHGFDYRDKEYGRLANIIRTWKRQPRAGLSWTFIPGYPQLPDNLLAWEYVDKVNALPSVSGFWRDDTLIVQSSLLRSIDVMTAKRGRLWFRANGHPAKRAGGMNARESFFAVMQSECFPEMPRMSVIRCELSR